MKFTHLFLALIICGWIGGRASFSQSLPVPVLPPSAESGDVSTEFNPNFTHKSEENFNVRTVGTLKVYNPRGQISVQGWTLDKIRVEVTKKAQAQDSAQAETYFQSMDLQYREQGQDIELSAVYGKGLSVFDRIEERRNQPARMDLVIKAPSKLKVEAWTVQGNVEVSGWNEQVSARSYSGDIVLTESSGSLIQANCLHCSIKGDRLKGELRLKAGSEKVRLSQVSGGYTFVETTSGDIELIDVDSTQTYVSKSGSISGKFLTGRIEFKSSKGNVNLDEVKGFVSGRTLSGNISVVAREWKFEDRALIESEDGNIELTLPSALSMELDVWSVYGKAELGFPLKKLQRLSQYGPEPKYWLKGVTGKGGELLKLFSWKGDIQLRQGNML